MDDRNSLSFGEDKNSIKFSIDSKDSKESKRSKRSSKRSEKNSLPKDFESEDISLSQLELMANKKKIKKPTEVEIVTNDVMTKKTEEKKTASKKSYKKSMSSSSLSVSSDTDTEKEKKREKNASRENKIDSIRKEKCEYLYKLDRLTAKSKWRAQKMDMDNTLEEIKNEYERISNEMKTDRSVAFFKRMLLLGVQGIEMMNTRFDPMGVDLEGWSEAMGYSLENQEYDDVMAELYEKYKGAGQMSPEVKLIFMIVSSATMFTISKKITKLDPESTFKNLLGSFVGNGGQEQQQQMLQQQILQQQQQQMMQQQQQQILHQQAMQQHAFHQQAMQQAQQSQVYVPSANDIRSTRGARELTETTEDIRPSKLKGPVTKTGDDIDIDNILKTMNDRKKEKDKEMEKLIDSLKTDTSDDVFKSISLNSNKKKGRGRPKKGNIAKA